jgi:uncharacterized protein (DUF2062 family)
MRLEGRVRTMTRIFMAMGESLNSMKQKVTTWLVQGITPRRLAFTLSLGFAIGCIPVVGIPTFACAALALALRLNLPAIQAANYIVMPLQLVLIVPFVRLGGWLMSSGANQSVNAGALLNSSPLKLLSQLGSLTGHAMLAWFVVSVPAVLLMTLMLNLVLRRIPALAVTEACD